MLTIEVVITEGFDEAKEEFVGVETFKLKLEHSLLSVSKWESKFERSFLDGSEKTAEETMHYLKCMSVDDVAEDIWSMLSASDYARVNEYINAKMTATWFSSKPKDTHRKEELTSELIYFWMISYGIPFECQSWHLNRLLTLIRVCNIKTSKPEKMSKAEMAERRRQLNAERRAKYNTSG